MYKIFEIDDLFENKKEDVLIVNLLQKNEAEFKAVYLKKNQEMRIYNINTNAAIVVLDGELELILNNEEYACNNYSCEMHTEEKPEENDEKIKIKKHQIFLTEKELVHSLTAQKDSEFLVVKM